MGPDAFGRHSLRRGRALFAALLFAAPALGLVALAGSAHAQRAWLVADAETGAVLAAHNANAPSFPASLTKLMTAFIAIMQIEAGELELEQKVRVSKLAADQPPTDMGLRAGSTITVEDALLGIIVRSANDAAVVLAEAMAENVDEFVAQMNFTAGDLGMRSTRFRNPSGLPDPEQVTTARDMALLSSALLDALPRHFAMFSRRSFGFAGRTIRSHNGFLTSYRGSDGLKTGFTCRAGFTLAATATRGSKRLVGVVLGARSAGQRSAKMRAVFDAGFKTLDGGNAKEATGHDLRSIAWAPEQGGDLSPNTKVLAGRCTARGSQRAYMRASNWSLEFAVSRRWEDAVSAANRVLRRNRRSLRGARPLIIPRISRDLVYRVGLTGMSRKVATDTCLELRKTRNFCVVMTPRTAEQAIRQGRRALAARGR